MKKDNLLWDLEPHTLGKHIVLKSYLDAWLPIMSRYNQKLLIIDGFAGPGEYRTGETGSPIIAIEAFLQHSYKDSMTNEVTFYFIEKSTKRCEHLKKIISNRYQSLPSNIKINIVNGVFDAHMNEVLDAVDNQNITLAPCFSMIDPFGVSHTPIALLKRLLANPKSELYISIMLNFINRFKKSKEFERHLDDLYGTTEWRGAIDIPGTRERYIFLTELYKSQLKRIGASNVLHFELFNGNKHVYSIFFASKHIRGSDKMKEAIWKMDPVGSFRFRGSREMHPVMNIGQAEFKPLENSIKKRFGNNWVDITELLNYVASDATDYYCAQLKTKLLRPLEKANQLEVSDQCNRKRKFTYPKGTILRLV